MKLFRYFGNKEKLTKFYQLPSCPVSRIVEPYLGSAAFSLNCNLSCPTLGYEINEDLFHMWKWLQQTNRKELEELNKFLSDIKSKEPKPNLKNYNLDIGPLTYLRINVTSLMVGQLNSWSVYPQHSLPIEDTIACLPKLKDYDIRLGSGESFMNEENDLVFIDPPYINTIAGYKSINNKNIESEYDPQKTIDLISKLSCPVIFTYGTNAQEIFPNFSWETVKVIDVARRMGGTKKRIEYVSYINFPKNNLFS